MTPSLIRVGEQALRKIEGAMSSFQVEANKDAPLQDGSYDAVP